jgi:alcohol dehydrogenase
VKALNKSLGIPEHLSEVGVTDDRIELMAEDAMKSGNILVNPRSTTKQDIISLYKRSL